MLALSALHAHIDLQLLVAVGEVASVNGEEFLVVRDVHRVDMRETAMTKGEIINGVQQIRLTLSVAADEAVDLRREVDLCRSDIFIIKDGNILEYHSKNEHETPQTTFLTRPSGGNLFAKLRDLRLKNEKRMP